MKEENNFIEVRVLLCTLIANFLRDYKSSPGISRVPNERHPAVAGFIDRMRVLQWVRAVHFQGESV
jgi:hypothetical protein